MLTLSLKSVSRAIASLRVQALLVVCLFGAAPVLTAEEAATAPALMVKMKNGDKQYFMCGDEPVLSFIDNVCHIESLEQSADFDMSLIDHAKIVKVDITAVDEIESALVVDLSDPAVVTIRGMKAGSPVAIYNLSGVKMRSAEADGEGYVSLEVGSLASGVYVVSSKETTFKIYKK